MKAELTPPGKRTGNSVAAAAQQVQKKSAAIPLTDNRAQAVIQKKANTNGLSDNQAPVNGKTDMERTAFPSGGISVVHYSAVSSMPTATGTGVAQLARTKYGYKKRKVNKVRKKIKKAKVSLLPAVLPQEDEDNMSLASDMEESNDENAINSSYVNPPKKPGEFTGERLATLKLRRLIRTHLNKPLGRKPWISKLRMQQAIAAMNKAHHPQNTISFSVASKRSGSEHANRRVSTKMGGVFSNHLGRILGTKNIKVTTSKSKTNEKHSEKILSNDEEHFPDTDVIIDKPRCSFCQSDQHISRFHKVFDKEYNQK